MLWTNSIKSKATGIALGASSLGIHLHPALLIEGRSDFLSSTCSNFPLLPSSHSASSMSNQLYLREHCDAGEIVALIPNTAAINLQNLRKRGILKMREPQFKLTLNPSSQGLSLFGSTFLGGTSVSSSNSNDNNNYNINCELTWRLAIEIAASSCLGNVSPWWHWIDSIKEEMTSSSSTTATENNHQEAFFLLQQEALRHLEGKFPPMFRGGYFADSINSVSKGRDAVFRDLMLQQKRVPVVPNLRAWNLAFEALRLRSVLTLEENSNNHTMFTPSILPIADLCAHSHSEGQEFQPNVVISIIDKESNQNTFNNNNLPSWVVEQQKLQVVQDVQDDRNWQDEMRFADVVVGENESDESKMKNEKKPQQHRKGPRKPLTLKEKMEKKMLFQHSKTQNNGRRRKNKSSSLMMNNNKGNQQQPQDVDFYYALELTKPCRAGEMLRLDWFELSPGPTMMMRSNDNDDKIMSDFSRALFMWQRFRVAVP